MTIDLTLYKVMADITKCEGTECPLKESCYRFLAVSNEFKHSYFDTVPYDKQNKKCAQSWAIPFCKLTKSNTHE